jgi:hypothetical protein
MSSRIPRFPIQRIDQAALELENDQMDAIARAVKARYLAKCKALGIEPNFDPQ